MLHAMCRRLASKPVQWFESTKSPSRSIASPKGLHPAVVRSATGHHGRPSYPVTFTGNLRVHGRKMCLVSACDSVLGGR